MSTLPLPVEGGRVDKKEIGGRSDEVMGLAERVEALGPVSRMLMYAEGKVGETGGKGDVRVVGYCRVSTMRQRVDGYSVLDQVKMIEAKVGKGGLGRLVAICIDDGISGSKGWEERPGLKAAMGLVRSGDVIMMSDVNRFFRETTAALVLFRDFFVRWGVKLDIFGLPDLNPKEPMSVLQFEIALSIAQYQRTSGNKRISEVMQTMSREGRLIKRTKYGWKSIAKGKAHVVHEVEMKGVAFVRSLVEGGMTRVGDIAKRLGESDCAWIPVRGKTGRWNGGKVRHIAETHGLRVVAKVSRVGGRAARKKGVVESELVERVRALRVEDKEMTVGTMVKRLQGMGESKGGAVYYEVVKKAVLAAGLEVGGRDEEKEAEVVAYLRELVRGESGLKLAEVVRRLAARFEPLGRCKQWYHVTVKALLKKHGLELG